MKISLPKPVEKDSSIEWHVDIVEGVNVYSTIFTGPYAEARARQYYGLLTGTVKQYDNTWCHGMPPNWPGCPRTT